MLTDEERREHKAKRNAAWNRANKEYKAKTHAAWCEANKEKVRKTRAIRREANKDCEVNKEKVRKINAAWNRANKEYKAKTNAAWQRAHPEAQQLQKGKRRVAKYGNTPISDMLTSTEWLAILALAAGHCAYCGKESKLTLDHIIPLSKAGTHSKNNVVPACGHCNSSKGNKTVEEWNAKRLTQVKQ